MTLALVFAACAASSPASAPVVTGPSSVPTLRLTDEMAEDEHGGVHGVFISWRGFDALVFSYELEKGDLRLKLAHERVDKEIAQGESAALQKQAERTRWIAVYGPWLGLVGGVTISGLAAAIVYGIVRAVGGSLPMQVLQAGQR